MAKMKGNENGAMRTNKATLLRRVTGCQDNVLTALKIVTYCLKQYDLEKKKIKDNRQVNLEIEIKRGRENQSCRPSRPRKGKQQKLTKSKEKLPISNYTLQGRKIKVIVPGMDR